MVAHRRIVEDGRIAVEVDTNPLRYPGRIDVEREVLDCSDGEIVRDDWMACEAEIVIERHQVDGRSEEPSIGAIRTKLATQILASEALVSEGTPNFAAHLTGEFRDRHRAIR